MIHSLVFTAAAAFAVALHIVPRITQWSQNQNTKVRRPALERREEEEESMRDS